MQIISFSFINLVDSFCRKSFLWLAICSWSLATFNLALFLFKLLIVFLDNSLCNLASLFNDFLRYLGFSINSPQLEIQNSLIPKSKPIWLLVFSNTSISTSVQHNDT